MNLTVKQINMLAKMAMDKCARPTVVCPRSIPSADTEMKGYSLFDRLIKTVNGKIPDAYARDNYLVHRKGWTRKGGYIYEPAKWWMFRQRPQDPGVTYRPPRADRIAASSM